MIIKYVNRGELDHRHDFIFNLIKLILEVTVTEFGEYRIEPYPNDPGVRRLSLLISDGDIVNLLWSTPGTAISQADVIPIPFDILQGLMGQRICLMNSTKQQLFNGVTIPSSLNDIRIGQGIGWTALQIYNSNNISSIVEGPTLEGLYLMLATDRFDCLPLGANEIVSTYRDNLAQIPSLSIEKNLLIHYDYPTYLYVSAKHPKLAERINHGLQKILANGKFKTLFASHYQKDLDILNLSARHEVCLTSPFLPLDKQCVQRQFSKTTNKKNKNNKNHQFGAITSTTTQQ